ncbi:DHA2 family efflux MFS transporter permease subunit [Propionibacterium freudenreichii]|jgi:EmrB/QacA subfamily drug resistance transporter|uniref:Membrane-bound transport protein (HemX protein) n=3 Tax=Propionibacterium freudenreichii TaxID=1744 RepID=D7GFS1_PROFC|nr:MDR family MFS transporter [Propionibacterium freudenreichii]PWN00056.1 MAG: MFS transporter [Propionibacterium sp.]CBL57382.1 Membrane-bound transport protein (HemX protein) [Propionibacterium freudenreichii subsp. shermanii CIRM-BIA1]AAB07864.1 membrane-bound transport protein [Propionibacterium freudenreichii]ARO11476.1 MFS transporter [Propionibacterium freudenreichii]MCT2976228.1 DHA2 family efflux MFS transporter permease subunit [Propionibacterium freudenreichii]
MVVNPHDGAATTQSTGRLLVALVVGGITAIMDTTIVAIGMHTLTEALHAPVSTLQWVSTGYLLALAVAIPFVSWAQTRFGGKRLWLFALGLFTVSSALCALSWSAASLIAFRVLQGFGGGIMFPLMQTLVMQHVDRRGMTRAMANVSLPIALGPIIGPVLGGVVLNWLSWHWLFLINVPIGVVGWVLAMAFITDDRPRPAAGHPRLDLVGAVLLSLALAGMLYGLSNAYDVGGFHRADVLVPALVGLALLAGFVAWARRRGSRALIDVRLLAVRSVRVSSVTLTLVGATLFSANFLLPLYFQSLRGYDALNAALLLIPQGIGSLLSRFIVSSLVARFGPRLTAVAGLLISAAATVPFALAGTDTGLWLLGTVLFVRGFGMGVVLIPIMTGAYVDIAREHMPHASAITRIVQQLGGAFGTALVAVALTSRASTARPRDGFDAAFWWTIAMTLAAAVAALFLAPDERPTAERTDATPASRQPAIVAAGD